MKVDRRRSDGDQRGEEDRIAGAIERSLEARQRGDTEHADWLDEVALVMDVPGTDHCVDVQVNDGTLIVRANKWGNTYWPLTEWLHSKGIEWGEF